MAYVAAYVSYPGILEIGVTVADLTTGKTVGKITSVTPVYETGLAVSPDGSLLYLVSQEGLTALNAANLAVAATAPYSTWYVEYETGVWSAPM
jgi:DNA-binding beta-propeller fold protein YncE